MSEESSEHDRLTDNGVSGVKRKSGDYCTAKAASHTPQNKAVKLGSSSYSSKIEFVKKSSGVDSTAANGRAPVAAAKKPAKPGISMKLGSRLSGGDSVSSSKQTTPSILQPKSGLAAAAFADDSGDEEEEEMPPEARIKMRNIGRDTPTSAGPNSYCKSKIGFCNSRKLVEKEFAEMTNHHK